MQQGRRRGAAESDNADMQRQAAGEDDQVLMQRLKAGDHEAFELIFRRYINRVSRQALRLLGDTAEAEEVVQEVFLTIYTKAHTFRGDSAFSTWLYRLTVNAALGRLRRRKGNDAVSLDDYLPRFQEDGHHLIRPVVDWSEALEDRVANDELRRLLYQAIEQLGPIDKAVVVLSDIEGMPDKEIGEILTLSVPAVKARLHRARLSLRGRLAVTLGHSHAEGV
jgi:RNA polymerase sigma-70 factor, ECF subfamily